MVGVFALAVLCGLFQPQRARAQTTTSNVEGIVRDEKGQPLADVEVVVRNQATGYYQIVTTDQNGQYRAVELIPGKYLVRAAHLDYTTVMKDGVILTVGETAVVDFALGTKGIEEKEVVVEAHEPVVDTKNSDLSTSVGPAQISALPLNTRNFLELAEVAPGAKGSTGGRGPVTTGAVNSRFMTAYIDGGDVKSDNLGGAVGTSFGVTTNIVPEDAIQEFQVITSLYKAEYTDASNGIINAITKSGGNEIHGSAFSYLRTQGMNAQGVYDKTKPDYNRQQYGLSIGGPIVRDQTHFFFSYERDNINNFLSVNTGGVRTDLDGTFKSPTIENLFLARITHQFSPDNTFDIRYLNVQTDNKPGNFGGVLAQNNGFNLKFRLSSFIAEDRWLIGKNLVNEVHLHYQHYFKDASPASSDPEFFYLSSNITTGWNANQPQNEDLRKIQLRDDIIYTVPEMAGSHTFKAGIDLEQEPLSSNAQFDKGAVFSFRTDTSAQPFQGIVGLGNGQTALLNNKYGVYIQDDWTVVRNLTLNLGVRWDVESNMINNGYVNPFANDTALTNHVPANYIGRNNRSIDYGRVAPRLGFAWDVLGNHTTALHGGFGLFYDRLIYNITSNEQQNGQYNIYTVRFGTNAPATTNRDTLIAYVQRNLGGASAPAVVLIPASVPSPYTRQFTIGVSRQISENLAVSLDYIQIRGFNEYTTYNVNYQNGIGGPRVATPAFAGIALLTSAGKSWYDAYQLGITRPYMGDWQMQFSYTLSWADNTFDDPFSNYVLQSSIWRAPSLQDERHRFVLSGLVNLPFGFQVSGLSTLASPRPIAVTTGTDDNHDGTTLDDFPYGRRNSARPSLAKIRYWYKDVDLRLTKYFTFMTGRKLGLFIEAFNLFNWTSYSGYFTILSQTTRFGLPNAAFATRQVQLGLRLEY